LCDSDVNECRHTKADHGPCISNESFKHGGCKYRTFQKDYKIINKGTKEEDILIDHVAQNNYQNEHSQWVHIKNLREKQRVWRPCEYFHQRNIALASSHSILNYSIFLSLSLTGNLPSRELLILDEAHLLETQIVEFTGISISKKEWRKYIPDLKIEDHGYDVKGWTDFLCNLKDMMINANILNEELLIEASQDIDKLELTINSIVSNPRNWIVSEITKEGQEVIKVELKPLDVSPYCKDVFRKCNKTLMMSATILDINAFCTSLGLAPEEVKFIQVPSDFPLQNRPIIPLNVAHLNSMLLLYIYLNVHPERVRAFRKTAFET
jgi:Rad3-related DNA helicase